MASGSKVFDGDDGTAVMRARRRPWLRWGAVAVVVILAGGIVAGLGGTSGPRRVDSPLIGKPAPSFRLTGLDGDKVASGDWAGHVYVVNFWASWCVPCRTEAPRLQDFWERHRSEGVGLVGVAYLDDPDEATAFRDELGLTFPQAMDSTGATASDFGVLGLPETFVVDERGIVMAKLVGAVGPTTLDDVLEQVQGGHTYTSGSANDPTQSS